MISLIILIPNHVERLIFQIMILWRIENLKIKLNQIQLIKKMNY